MQINKTMQQFAQENARMEMTQEMMGDTLDSALDDETTEDDAAELVGQVSRGGGRGGEGREWVKGAEHDDTRKVECNCCGLADGWMGKSSPPPLHQTRFKPSESAVGDEATQGGAAELDGHVLCRDL